MDNLLNNHDFTLVALKYNLSMAQYHMKKQEDKHHFEREFEVGDQVFICFQPYNKTSLKAKGHQKLTPKLHGPY